MNHYKIDKYVHILYYSNAYIIYIILNIVV